LRAKGSSSASIVAIAVASLGLFVSVARADTPAAIVSPNWSGYVATSPASGATISYTRASGTWTVPTATCTHEKAGAASTIWVGLGGYNSAAQDAIGDTATVTNGQVGTDSSCDAKDKPTYYAWFQLQPYPSYTIQHHVSPGDTITGLVTYLSPTVGEVKVADQTAGWTFTRKLSLSYPDETTAEWIVEAPANCVRFACTQASLAKFGAVTMRGISAVGNGKTGTLSDPSWNVTAIKLVPGLVNVPNLGPATGAAQDTGEKGRASSPAGATPGKLSSGGSAFNLKWVAVATKGL
jgi:hypothetical protein